MADSPVESRPLRQQEPRRQVIDKARVRTTLCVAVVGVGPDDTGRG